MVKQNTKLTSAPPPLHSVAVLGAMIAIFLSSLPSLESIDEDATIETITDTAFESLSMQRLAWIRLIFAGIIFSVSIRKILGEGFIQTTNYMSHSKISAVPLKFHGIWTMCHFTQCTWNLLGLSFLLLGLTPLLVSYGREDIIEKNPWLLRAALLVFETAAPSEMLVAAVVKYAIWPKLLKEGKSEGTANLKKFDALMMHNVSVFMVLFEVGFMGGIPIRISDLAVAPLWGICYVLFTWFMANRWSPKDGPQFIYFFLDTTLGKTTTIALLMLLGVLLSFYAMFWIAKDVLNHLGGPLARMVVIGAVSSSVCRFRD